MLRILLLITTMLAVQARATPEEYDRELEDFAVRRFAFDTYENLSTALVGNSGTTFKKTLQTALTTFHLDYLGSIGITARYQPNAEKSPTFWKLWQRVLHGTFPRPRTQGETVTPPLLYRLLNDAAATDRPAKFGALVEVGLLTDDSLKQFAAYLNNARPSDEETLLRFFQVIFRSNPRLHEGFVHTAEKTRQSVKQFLDKEQTALLSLFLKKGFYWLAAQWLDALWQFGIPAVIRSKDVETGYSNPIYMPVLACLLQELRDLQTQATRYEQVRKLRDRYLRGVGRTYLAKLLDQEVLASDAEQRPRTPLEEFINYINARGPRMVELRAAKGLEKLFLMDLPEEDLLLKAAALRKRDFIKLTYFLFRGQLGLPKAANGQPLLHALLNQPEGILDAREERIAVTILKFFFYSDRVPFESLQQALTTPYAKTGETLLAFAASNGLFRCFKLIQNFMAEKGIYNHDDHNSDMELGLLLLKGLGKRMLAARKDPLLPGQSLLHDDTLVDNARRLAQFYTENPPLRPYRGSSDQKENMNLLLEDIGRHLNRKLQKGQTALETIYKPVFRSIQNFFFVTEIFGGFLRAPSKIQMTYLQVPLARLAEKLKNDYSLEDLQELDLLSRILRENPGKLTQYQLDAIRNFMKAQFES